MCRQGSTYDVVYETDDVYYIVSDQGEKFGIEKNDLEDDLYVVIHDL